MLGEVIQNYWISKEKKLLLNKRSELVSKFRHEAKYLLGQLEAD